ncbi:MAG: transglutaminase domain-containing protein [Planctomycetes bacterium]|nr:transglutaminase domain-containing protein [Planctomycetota bacterium]
MKRLGAICAGLALASCASSGRPQPMQGDDDRQQTVNLAYVRPGDRRTFAIEYVGRVSAIPAGTKTLRIWMPVPQDTTVQSIRDLRFSRKPRLATEPRYGNRIAYWEIAEPGESVEISMSFTCSRIEILTDLALLRQEGQDPPGRYSIFKHADTLVVVDEEIRRLSDEITRGRNGTVEKARAIYEYVVSRMSYDKNHAGWGTGSTRHACEAGKGNCTDFHALFNSLCRAQGIASGFEIGLYLPYERRRDEKLGGYHCWAFFRVPGKTWVPVDCSEAKRNPDRLEFFFGGHTSNRVTLSTGRDIVLEPRQEGAPLNYFLNPDAEADGKPVKTEKAWSYRDLD